MSCRKQDHLSGSDLLQATDIGNEELIAWSPPYGKIPNVMIRARPLLPLLLNFAIVAGAQTTRELSPKEMPASAHKLIAIKVTGTERYTPEEVIAASGLKLGETVNEEDFKHAARRLGEAGAFSDVAYNFSYSPEGTRLELQVADADKFVPAYFENFVWFSDKELADKIRQFVPLFKGEIPLAGNVVDQVSDALQALLVERGIPGHADYLRSGPDNGPIDSIHFSVSDVTVRIRDLEFPGAAESDLRQLNAAARQLQGAEYTASKVTSYAEKDLLPVYLKRGYLKASIAAPQPKLVEDKPPDVQVDVSLPVTLGNQYKIDRISWSGYKAFPADKLNSMLHVAPGQLANAIQLARDLQEVEKLYGTHGYMTATAKPSAQLNDAQGTVSYQIQVKEGDVYLMGDLDIQGPDSKVIDRLRSAWKLHEGQPYDSSYPMLFVKDTNQLLPANFDWGVTLHEFVNQKDKVVDVSLHFTPKT
jgi:outer membrane protein insertion porin family